MWSFANVMYFPPPVLLRASASRAEELWPLKPQEMSNLLWAFDRVGDRFLASLTEEWLQQHMTSPDLFSQWTGEQLLKLMDHMETSSSATEVVRFVAQQFRQRYYNPVVQFFVTLPEASLCQLEYVKVLRSFELFHLGPNSTPRALVALRAALGDSAEELAFREAAIASLLVHYTSGDSLSAREPAVLHGGQTTARWIAAVLRHELHGPSGVTICEKIVAAGRIDRKQEPVTPDFGALRDVCTGTPWLWSLKLAGDVGRDTHCEFVALSEVVSQLEAWGLEGPPRVTDVGGKVWLFTTHYPCISCLGVIAQFQWRFPAIDLRVGGVDWREWQRLMRARLDT